MEFDVIGTEDSVVIDGDQYYSLMSAVKAFRKKIECIQFRRHFSRRKPKRVRWLEGGFTYKSINKAARSLKIDPAYLFRNLEYNKKYKRYSLMKHIQDRYTFVYVDEEKKEGDNA